MSTVLSTAFHPKQGLVFGLLLWTLSGLRAEPVKTASGTMVALLNAPAVASPNPGERTPFFVARSRSMLLQPAGLPARGAVQSGRSRLNLFADKDLETEWVQFETPSSRSWHWTGRLTDDPLSAVDLTQLDEQLELQVTSPKHGNFDVAVRPDGSCVVREFDSEKLKGNGACYLPTTNAEYSPVSATATRAGAYTAGPVTAGYTTSTVDVLVVYTPGVLTAMGTRAAVVAKAQAGVNSENSTFGRSQIVHAMRLVHTRQINYNGSGNLGTDLGWVAGSSEVAAIRDEVGADIVALMSDKDSNGTLGIAQMPGPFSACYYDTFSGVWPHEVGHNQGCSHNKEAGGPGVYSYSYAHWWNNGTSEIGTIMSYRGSRIAWFSNPNVLYGGFPTGVANDQENARTINEYDPTVASWKPSKTLMDAALAMDVSTLAPAERVPFDIHLVVTNLGPATATTIQVSAPVPTTLSWVSDNGGGTYNKASGLWTVPSLAASGTASLTITAQPNSGTRGSSIAITGAVTSVGSTFVDFDYYNNFASATIVPLPDLSTTFFWTNGNSGVWSAAVNWTNGLAPPAGGSSLCTLEFVGSGGYAAGNDLPGTFSTSFLELANGSTTPSTLSGNPIQFIPANPSLPSQMNQRSAAAATINNRLLLAGDLTLNAPSGNPLTLAGSIGGTGNLRKNSANKLALTASNDFSGLLTISGGYVEAGHVQCFARSAGIVLSSGAHLDLKSPGIYPAVPAQVSGNGNGGGAFCFNQGAIATYTWPGTITLLGDTRLGAYGVAITNNLTGPITGAGDLSLYGQGGGNTHVGVFVLGNPANAWSGDTAVDAGSSASAQLKLGVNNALPVATRLTLNAYGDAYHFAYLDLSGFSQTLAGLTSGNTNNNVANSSSTVATLTLNLDHDFACAAAMSGNFTLAKNGSGMLTLSGKAAHTAGTLVSAGNLAVDGSLAPGLVQIAGARLGGTGFVQSALLTNTASLYPGFRGSPSTLAISNLTCAAGTQLRFSLTNVLTVGAGINDFLPVTNLACSGSTLVALNLLSATPAAGRYVLVRSPNAFAGTNYFGLAAEEIGTRYQPSLDLSMPGELGLVIASAAAPKTLTWRGDGTANAWDLNLTTNWVSGAAPERFFNADSVIFNDTGSNSPTVSLAGSLAPTVITVSSTNGFTLGGSGTLVGPVSISKSGSGGLTLNTANSFNGGMAAVGGGTLALGSANALRGLDSVSVSSGAVLQPAVSGATYASLPLAIAGSGAGRGALYFYGGTHTLPGPISLSSSAQIGAYAGGNNYYNLSGPISGAGNLNFWAGGAASSHAHIFTLSGGSTYAGDTSLDTYAAGCYVRLSDGPNRLPATTVLTLKAGIWNSQVLTAQFELRGCNQTLAGLTTGTPIFGTSGNNRVINGSTASATLTLAQYADYTFSGALGNSNSNDDNFGLVKAGSGALTLSGSNTFSGGLVISGGTLKMGNARSLGATNGTVVITNTGTLDLAGFSGATNHPVVLSGAGADGNDAITSTAQIPTPFIGLRYVTLAGDTVLNTPTRWDIGNLTVGGTLTGNGRKLTFTGSNDCSLNSLGETGLGDVVVNNRTLYIQGNTTLGLIGNVVSVYPGSTLNLWGSGINIAKPLALNGGTLANGSGNATYSGPVALNSNSTVSAVGAFTLSGAISGAAGFTNTATKLVMTGNNSYQGGTFISSGTVNINGDAALGANSSPVNLLGSGTLQAGAATVTLNGLRNLTLNNGASVTLDCQANQLAVNGSITGAGALNKIGSGTLTLAGNNTYSGTTTATSGKLMVIGIVGGDTVTVTNAVLGGSGLITGPVTIRNGGTLSPGVSVPGQLVVSNSLALNAGCTSLFRLDAGALSNDSVAGLSRVSYGGTLVVTNVNGSLSAGQTFKLFRAASYGGGFAAINLPPLADGLTWSNRLLVDGTIGVYVTAPAAPVNLSASGQNSQVALTWNGAAGASSYNLKRATVSGGYTTNLLTGLTGTNATDSTVANGTTYYYVVTAVSAGGESPWSNEAAGLPYTAVPGRLSFGMNGSTLSLSWPAEYKGWTLQIQTNSLGQGLGTNWAVWPGSETNTTLTIPIDAVNPSVFLRLTHPVP